MLILLVLAQVKAPAQRPGWNTRAFIKEHGVQGPKAIDWFTSSPEDRPQ